MKLLQGGRGRARLAIMNNKRQILTDVELAAILQRHYRRFIEPGLSFTWDTDGRVYLTFEFADDGVNNNGEPSRVSGNVT